MGRPFLRPCREIDVCHILGPIAEQQVDQSHSFTPLGRKVKALMVWPAFSDSFWSFRGSVPIFGKKAMQPPLGLLTVAALCPPSWSIKLIDQAVEELTDSID